MKMPSNGKNFNYVRGLECVSHWKLANHVKECCWKVHLELIPNWPKDREKVNLAADGDMHFDRGCKPLIAVFP